MYKGNDTYKSQENPLCVSHDSLDVLSQALG